MIGYHIICKFLAPSDHVKTSIFKLKLIMFTLKVIKSHLKGQMIRIQFTSIRQKAHGTYLHILEHICWCYVVICGVGTGEQTINPKKTPTLDRQPQLCHMT